MDLLQVGSLLHGPATPRTLCNCDCSARAGRDTSMCRWPRAAPGPCAGTLLRRASWLSERWGRKSFIPGWLLEDMSLLLGSGMGFMPVSVPSFPCTCIFIHQV